MIDVKELMIGNHLRDIDSGCIGIVRNIYYDDESTKDTEIGLDIRRTCDNPCRGIVQARERSFEPIPLTEDEFVKFGFTIISRDLYVLKINSFFISITKDLKKAIPLMTRFGTKNVPLVVIADENLNEIDAIWSENNPDWLKVINKKLINE